MSYSSHRKCTVSNCLKENSNVCGLWTPCSNPWQLPELPLSLLCCHPLSQLLPLPLLGIPPHHETSTPTGLPPESPCPIHISTTLKYFPKQCLLMDLTLATLFLFLSLCPSALVYSKIISMNKIWKMHASQSIRRKT